MVPVSVYIVVVSLVSVEQSYLSVVVTSEWCSSSLGQFMSASWWVLDLVIGHQWSSSGLLPVSGAQYSLQVVFYRSVLLLSRLCAAQMCYYVLSFGLGGLLYRHFIGLCGHEHLEGRSQAGAYRVRSGLQWRESGLIRYLVCWLYACSVWCVCIVFGLCLRVGMVLIRCVSSVYVGVMQFILAFRLVQVQFIYIFH